MLTVSHQDFDSVCKTVVDQVTGERRTGRSRSCTVVVVLPPEIISFSFLPHAFDVGAVMAALQKSGELRWIVRRNNELAKVYTALQG